MDDDAVGDPGPGRGAPGTDDATAFRSVFERRSPPPMPGEGLRDRKKRLLRQLISDTATGMFLERGFDEVKVSEIAEACEVSEKTIYNYFPTKESLLFDREEDQAIQIAEALRDRGDGVSLVDSVVGVLETEMNLVHGRWVEAGHQTEGLSVIRRFAELVENTPGLAAAQYGMMERLTEVAAQALAERAGVDPEDPEPQLAATIIMGLWHAEYRAMRRYADGTLLPDEVRAAVLDDIRRAASVADSGLSSYNAMAGATTNKDQLKEAAEAADLARKQVVAAMRQAKAAWRQVMAEVHAHHHLADDGTDWRETIRDATRGTQRDVKERQQEIRAEIRLHQQELRLQHARLRQQQAEARRAKRRR